jgi:hypothetical protein
MERTEANIEWALMRLNQLRTMEGFPRFDDQQVGLRLMARLFLNIVDDQPEVWVEEYDPAQGKGVRRMIQPAISAEETTDWLLEQVVLLCDRFPALIQMRRIYEARWRTADRKSSGELTLPLEH